MGRSFWRSILCSWFATAMLAAVAWAQPPIDVTPPSGPPPVIGLSEGPPAPAPMQPPIIVPAGPALESFAPSYGWFVDLGGGAVLPHLSHVKTSSDGAMTFLSGVSSVGFDWGPAGEVDLGYRFAGGNGLRLSYHAFGSSARADSTGDATLFEPMFFAGLNGGYTPVVLTGVSVGQATRQLRSDVQLNRIDLDYLSAEHVFGDTLHLTWLVGARVVVLRVDSRVNDTFTLSDDALASPLTLSLQQRAADETAVGGVHAGVDGAWTPVPGPISMFGLLDAGILAGGSTQKYTVGIAGNPLVASASGSEHGGSVVGTIDVQAGVQYTVSLANSWRLRLRGGYEFELYDFEATGGGASKHALYKGFDLTGHGLFVQGELGF